MHPIISYLEDIIYSRSGNINSIELSFSAGEDLTQEIIMEQIQKGKKAIETEDDSGVITTTITLLEAVFLYIDKKINGTETINLKDDIIKKYSTLKEHLNLDASQEKLPEFLQQVLRGLSGIVCGLSHFRNKASDAHHSQYNVAKHHAVLAVNSANTLAQFLFDTYTYQSDMNTKKSK